MAEQIRRGLQINEECRAAYRDFEADLATLTEALSIERRPRQSVPVIMFPAAWSRVSGRYFGIYR